MRLIVIADRLAYDGRTYRKGEELELADKEPERTWAIAFQALNQAKLAEPVIIQNPRGRATPPQRPQQPPPPPPTDASWMRPAWETQEQAAPEPAAVSPESPSPDSPAAAPDETVREPETQDDGSLFPTGGPRRYRRRDIRAEE